MAKEDAAPSANHVIWLEEVARTTERSGQYLVAARFREIAQALEAAERMNTLTLKRVDNYASALVSEYEKE